MSKISSSPKMVQLHKEIEEEALIARIKLESRNEILAEIKKEKEISKKDNVSHEVQILILHYLSIGEEINKNNEKAKLYSPIINRNVEVTRQKLTYIEDSKTKNNLEFLLNYFQAFRFEDQIDQIKKDLEKIK